MRLVDSGTAGFGISCCVWAAADAVARGASIDEAVQIAESLSPQIGAVFIVGQPEFLRTGNANDKPDGIPVMRMHDGRLEVVDHVTTAIDAVHAMVRTATGWGSRLNVAVGLADSSGERLIRAVATAIGESPNVVEVVRYRIGPSVGAYAGLGTVGCFMFTFPLPFFNLGFILKSLTMSNTIFSNLLFVLNTFCMFPHCRFNSAFGKSFIPFVTSSNQTSIPF